MYEKVGNYYLSLYRAANAKVTGN